MDRVRQPAAQWLRRHPRWPILVLLAAWLAAAVWLGNDFGSTFDERKNAVNGAAALRAYQGSPDYFRLSSVADHGPIYFAAMSLTAPAIQKAFPGWTVADGRHLTHFLTFLAAVGCFYLLTLRLSGRTAAWMASALFATQPLLVGHGFINQKDTPFMALFLGAFVAGLAASERPPVTPSTTTPPLRERMKTRWRAMRPLPRSLVLASLLVATLIIVDTLWTGVMRSAGETWLRAAYQGAAPAAIQRLFDAVTADPTRVPLSYYLGRFANYYAYEFRFVAIAGALLGSLVVVSAAFPGFGEAWGLSRSAYRNPALWLAAVLLGALICVRQLGIFAGGLVTLAMLYRHRARALFPLLLYWTAAAIVLYATWPFLWPAPIERLAESLAHAATFPSNVTFFEGSWVTSDNLPWYYFPKLTAMQLTEPAVLLAVIGIGAVILRRRSWRKERVLFLLLGLWIAVPAVGLAFFRMTAYGNIRHLLFTLPAILAFTAVAFDLLRRHVRPGWLAWSFFGMAILPGIWSLISLHPYEYVYMNRFAGGVSGAYGRYELDRQCTALREGIEAANRLADPGAVVAVPRQLEDVRPYARPDLRLIADGDFGSGADFVLTCSWPDEEDLEPGGLRRVYSVRRGEAVLAALWQR